MRSSLSTLVPFWLSPFVVGGVLGSFLLGEVSGRSFGDCLVLWSLSLGCGVFGVGCPNKNDVARKISGNSRRIRQPFYTPAFAGVCAGGGRHKSGQEPSSITPPPGVRARSTRDPQSRLPSRACNVASCGRGRSCKRRTKPSGPRSGA